MAEEMQVLLLAFSAPESMLEVLRDGLNSETWSSLFACSKAQGKCRRVAATKALSLVCKQNVFVAIISQIDHSCLRLYRFKSRQDQRRVDS